MTVTELANDTKSRHMLDFTGDVTHTRRECLGTVAAVASLTGCSTDTTRDVTTDTQSGQLYKLGDNLYSTSPDVEIVWVEEGHGDPPGVVGVVTNVGDHVLDLVQVNVFFYDEEGDRIDTAVAQRSHLHPSVEWRFTVQLTEARSFSTFRLIVQVLSD